MNEGLLVGGYTRQRCWSARQFALSLFSAVLLLQGVCLNTLCLSQSALAYAPDAEPRTAPDFRRGVHDRDLDALDAVLPAGARLQESSGPAIEKLEFSSGSSSEAGTVSNAYSGRSPAEAGYNQPRYGQVEQWYGSRHRTKHVPGAQQQASLPVYQPVSYQVRQSLPRVSSSDESSLRHPDKYIDTAQVDSDGSRHFANGKHFDLSKVSLSQVLADAKGQKGFLDRRSREQFFGSDADLQGGQGGVEQFQGARFQGDRFQGDRFQGDRALRRQMKRLMKRRNNQRRFMNPQSAYSAYWQ